jgi:predicted ABC-type ATPase
MGKRLRILAGPNGSGKSSVYKTLVQKKEFQWGVFVNADEIEKKLREEQYLNIQSYGVEDFDWGKFQADYQSFVDLKGGKCGVDNLRYIDKKLFVLDAHLVDSYLASYVATYIRNGLLLLNKKDFTFTIETVMSHESKLDFMRAARERGYRIYLYYISTSSPEINVGRVATRVLSGGHNVPEDKIKSRYERSLRNLHEAILLSDRAYIFDNSESSHKWIAEYDGATGELRYKEDEIPQWVGQYV